MVHQQWWSQVLLLASAASASLAAWPFRRKEIEEPEDTQAIQQEDQTTPEIDQIDWGIRLGMLERYERAAERFQQAVQSDPDDPFARYNLALALDLAGRHEEAKDAFQQLISSDSEIPDAHLNLGLSLLDLGDYSGAIEATKAACRLAPDDATFTYDLGCIYALQARWSDAVSMFEQAVKADPKDAQTRFNLAIALRKSGDKADAERELRDFLVLARGRYPAQREYAEELLRSDYGDTGGTNAP